MASLEYLKSLFTNDEEAIAEHQRQQVAAQLAAETAKPESEA